jgi:hypothetical protein
VTGTGTGQDRGTERSMYRRTDSDQSDLGRDGDSDSDDHSLAPMRPMSPSTSLTGKDRIRQSRVGQGRTRHNSTRQYRTRWDRAGWRGL